MPECVAVPPSAGARGSERWVVDLAEADNPVLCGGKAAGLARLRRASFPVPDGICLTTEFCRAALRKIDVAARVRALAADHDIDPHTRGARLAEIRRLIEDASLPVEIVDVIQARTIAMRKRWNGMLAIRSSAVLEDHADASHAGIHATYVGQYAAPAVVGRVKACWASLWSERAWAYRERLGIPHAEAAMAVVVQRFVAGGRAGVAFSADPLTGDPAAVVIEAAWGTGEAVVAGALRPERYRVSLCDETPTAVRVEASSGRPVVSESEIRTLARLVKRVQHAIGEPADVEWAYDGSSFWVVQARPIQGARAPRDETLWTRANLKEVFPDQPSPLAATYLSVALNRMFREYNGSQGYDVPAGTSLVGVFRGRPYLNLTLMNKMAVARGGSPDMVARLFGGATPPATPADRQPSRPVVGLRHSVRLARELLTTVFLTPRRARRLFRRMRRQARSYAAVPLERLDDAAVTEHLIRFANTLLHPATLRRLHEIVSAQSRAYMLLERLLIAWVPVEAERLLAQLMTGLGTLPNTQLTYRLMALSELARAEPRVGAFLANGLDREALGSYRSTLAGTRFLGDLDGLLREFGHRAPFESDVMSPRFSEEPEPLLRMIQAYLRMPALENPQRHEAYRRRIREAARRDARLALQQGRSWRAFTLQWTILSVVCGALQQLLAQRDENRHVTTLLVAQLRRVALEIGNRAARDGRFATPEDVFFVLWEELPTVLTGPPRDWRALIGARRQERNRHATATVPDLLRGDEAAEAAPRPVDPEDGNGLMGFGVSPGTVSGTVKVIRSPADLRALRGEIAVLPAIEPSLASIFPLVSGLVAEIGGVLSHAAILAREYGLPAVVNVEGATRRLRDGDRIELDGRTGRICLLGRESGAGHGGGAVPQDQRGDHEADERARHHV